ncbi:MAG TPA: hypothetical protein VKA04_05860 [Pseudodesulfovibrio sp.]|nr:hypothetical protein [Pseudodesulfovibrio sp.]
MSMDNDTRLAMMHMRNEAHRNGNGNDRPRRNNSRHVRPAITAVVSLAMLLFTRAF